MEINKAFIDSITRSSADGEQRDLGYDLLLKSYIIHPAKYNIKHGLKLLSKISREKNNSVILNQDNINNKLKEYIINLINYM